MKTAYLGLGSNLGDRQANLDDAVRRLASERVTVKRRSSIWETAPRDVLDQPWFLNQVIEVETDLFPRPTAKRLSGIKKRKSSGSSFLLFAVYLVKSRFV